jgi:hypothetical protein
MFGQNPLKDVDSSVHKELKYSRNEHFNLLHYVEWDRFVALAGSKSGLRVTLQYLALTVARNVHSGTLKIWETGVI